MRGPLLDAPQPSPSHEPEIPEDRLDPEAIRVIARLRHTGHQAYFVGGCVRDVLLGHTPKDFDVATSAHPGEVRATFRNCRLIGRRFRLAHVYFRGGKVIEVATFRTIPTDAAEDLPESDLLITRDNVFGTAEEDARRRDFTVNGLFYDVFAGEVIDYVGGRADLEAHRIATIGDPEIRMREDPVRALRAIRFASRLGFTIEPETFADSASEDARRRFLAHLSALDALVRAGEDPSEAVLLGALLLHLPAADRGVPNERDRLLAELVATARLPRRIAERTRLALASRGQSRRRKRGASTPAYFADAMQLLQITVKATGEGAELLERWRTGDGHEGDHTPGDAIASQEISLERGQARRPRPRRAPTPAAPAVAVAVATGSEEGVGKRRRSRGGRRRRRRGGSAGAGSLTEV